MATETVEIEKAGTFRSVGHIVCMLVIGFVAGVLSGGLGIARWSGHGAGHGVLSRHAPTSRALGTSLASIWAIVLDQCLPVRKGR